MAHDEDDEMPEEEKETDDFDLLPEGSEYVSKVDFKSIIFRQYDRTARSATQGDPISFSNGVMVLKGLVAPYFDNQFIKKLEDIDKKHQDIIDKLTTESEDDKEKAQENAQILQHFQSEKLYQIFEEIGLLLKRKAIIK